MIFTELVTLRGVYAIFRAMPAGMTYNGLTAHVGDMDDSMANENKAAGKAYLAQGAETYRMRDTRFSSLLTVLGFACFWACIVTVLASFFFGPLNQSMFDAFLLRLLFLLGFVVIQFSSYVRVIGRISERKLHFFAQVSAAAMVVLFLVMSLVPPLKDAGGSLFALHAAVWLLFGATSGLFLVTWGIAWTQLDAERPDGHASAISVAASAALAVALCVFLFFAPTATVAVASVGILYLASVAIQAYYLRHSPAREDIDIVVSKQRLDLFSRNMLSPLFVGTVFGFTMYVALFSPYGHPSAFALPLSLVPTCLMLGSGAALLVLVVLKRVPRFSTFERLIFPLLGGGLLLLPFSQGALQQVVVMALGAGAVCFFIAHFNVLVSLSYRHRVRASFHYLQGLIAPLGGAALGWGVSCVFYSSLGVESPHLIAVICLSLVFLLILIMSIAPYASHKTVEALAGTVEEEIQDKPGAWRRRAEKACVTYALTPREKEVFLLLAKGRNTEYIAKQLFISSHTAKTHTARIYRKLSINSQQELIDIVD